MGSFFKNTGSDFKENLIASIAAYKPTPSANSFTITTNNSNPDLFDVTLNERTWVAQREISGVSAQTYRYQDLIDDILPISSIENCEVKIIPQFDMFGNLQVLIKNKNKHQSPACCILNAVDPITNKYICREWVL